MSDGQILHWLEETENEILPEIRPNPENFNSALENELARDEDDADHLSGSDHNSDSENSASNDEEFVLLGPQYLGKDQTPWNIHPPRQQRLRARRNLLSQRPGVRGPARDVTNVLDAWKIFFPDTVLQSITDYTNAHLTIMRDTYKTRSALVKDTNIDEMSALVGILYMLGYMNSSHQSVEDLWTTDGTAPPFFRLVMSYQRFLILLRALRFNDSSTRVERKAVDKFAPIRELFEDFVRRCMDSYSVGECVTIDEMLENFRGRCSFRQYMLRKPAKYGIKMFALVDSDVFYTSKIEVYCGTQPNGPYNVDNRPAAVVNRMIDHIQGTGRNVTMDNWFTSVPLVNQLVEEKSLTVVATLKKNEKEIPTSSISEHQSFTCE